MAGLVPAIHAVGRTPAAEKETLKVEQGFRRQSRRNGVDARDEHGHHDHAS